jgi:hypothetical protein
MVTVTSYLPGRRFNSHGEKGRAQKLTWNFASRPATVVNSLNRGHLPKLKVENPEG